MASRIGKGEWVILYVATGIIDVLQFVIGIFEVPLSLFAIGLALIAANEAVGPAIGLAILAYFEVRGVRMITHPKRILSLLCVEVIDGFSLDIASLWILDIWYIQTDLKKEDMAIKTAQEKREQEAAMQGIQKNCILEDEETLPSQEQTSQHIRMAPAHRRMWVGQMEQLSASILVLPTELQEIIRLPTRQRAQEPAGLPRHKLNANRPQKAWG